MCATTEYNSHDEVSARVARFRQHRRWGASSIGWIAAVCGSRCMRILAGAVGKRRSPRKTHRLDRPPSNCVSSPDGTRRLRRTRRRSMKAAPSTASRSRAACRCSRSRSSRSCFPRVIARARFPKFAPGAFRLPAAPAAAAPRLSAPDRTTSHGPGGVVSNTVDFRGDASKLGDLTLLGQYRFINSVATRTEAAFLFGIKLPTGATNRLDAKGLLFETEFQPGSGSTDLLLGAAFTQALRRLVVRREPARHHHRARLAGHQARQPLPVQRRRLLPPRRPAQTGLDYPHAPAVPRCRTGRCSTATPHPLDKIPALPPGPSTRCSSSTANGTTRTRPPT